MSSSKGSSSKRKDSPMPRDRKSSGGSSSASEKSGGGTRHGRRSSETITRQLAADAKKAKEKERMAAAEKNEFNVLPKLKDVADEEKENLFRAKLQLCCKLYDFNNEQLPLEKEAKRQTLLELVEFVNTKMDVTVTENMMKDSMNMCAANIFRSLFIKERSPLDIVDPEDDEPYLDKEWPHLEIAYEFLLRYVSSKDIPAEPHPNAKLAVKHLNSKFTGKLLALLDSDDARERDYIKMIMQRIYSKFISLRTFIRRAIQNACLKAIYESEMQNGIQELLELLQNIISGFKVPLKSEHRALLFKVLIPLHKVRSLPFFHASVAHCISQYVEKDPRFISEIVHALLHIWPNSMAAKQVLFMDEIEEMLSLVKSHDWPRLQDAFIRQLCLCISSEHIQVADRAMGFWKNDHIYRLFNMNRKYIYPGIVRALYKNTRQHWHANVHARTMEVFRVLVETDHDLFDECSAESRKMNAEDEVKDSTRRNRWKLLQETFDKKGGAKAAKETAKYARRTILPNGKSCEMLGRRGTIALAKGKYGLAVSYESGHSPVELTVQCCLVDDRGVVVDALFDDRKSCLEGAVYMQKQSLQSIVGASPLPGTNAPGSGRSRGAGRVSVIASKASEIVWAHLNKLPSNIRMVIFFVTSFNRGHIKDAGQPMVSIVEEADRTFIAQYAVEPSSTGDVGAIAMFRRISTVAWNLIRVEEYARFGRHYMDALEPTLGTLVRQYIQAAPKRLKINLPLPRGGIVTLPSALMTKWLFVGVGWDLAPAANEGLAMEVGVLLVDQDGYSVQTVTAEDAGKVGIKHGGNSLVSAGMTFELDAIPQKVNQMVIVATITSENQHFIMAQHPHMRIVDRSGMELVRADSIEKSYKSGLVLGRLYREPRMRRWSYQAMFAFVDASGICAMVEAARPHYSVLPRQYARDREAETTALSVSPAEKPARRRVIVSL
eukprot:TRINITY_DN13372_c0_g1_i1.p1 TRINITY_DN13372_c0_g1~~TRINITY_DN13372_c0_g1_i1.p1  ORF type:complete len:945 (-),score=280.51 TRINITY_DN13372_c0_g1_i1:158-2992(-)